MSRMYNLCTESSTIQVYNHVYILMKLLMLPYLI